MAIVVSALKEADGENRVAMTPDIVSRLVKGRSGNYWLVGTFDRSGHGEGTC